MASHSPLLKHTILGALTDAVLIMRFLAFIIVVIPGPYEPLYPLILSHGSFPSHMHVLITNQLHIQGGHSRSLAFSLCISLLSSSLPDEL